MDRERTGAKIEISAEKKGPCYIRRKGTLCHHRDNCSSCLFSIHQVCLPKGQSRLSERWSLKHVTDFPTETSGLYIGTVSPSLWTGEEGLGTLRL